MGDSLLVVLIVANLPLYLVLGKVMFGGWRGFAEAVGYWFQSDWWSFVTGHGWNDFLAESILLVYVVLCGGAVYGEYWALTNLFGF